MTPTKSITDYAIRKIDSALENSIQVLIDKLKDNDLINDDLGEDLRELIIMAIDKKVHQFYETVIE